jgi:hypothetical protein
LLSLVEPVLVLELERELVLEPEWELVLEPEWELVLELESEPESALVPGPVLVHRNR